MHLNHYGKNVLPGNPYMIYVVQEVCAYYTKAFYKSMRLET